MRNFNGLEARGAALVTGASRGLGFALAGKLKERGFELILHGRDAEALSAAAEKLGAAYYAADLSAEGAAKALYERIKADGFTLSVLVNNAGLGASGEAWTVSEERDGELIAVNVCAATELSKLFLSDACGRGYGALLNVCSVGAFQPGPYTASYYASKAYLHSYTLAVREEAKKYGVTVCSLCPGPLDTEFFGRAGAKKPRGAMSAEKAAGYAVKKFSAGGKTIVPGFLNRLARVVPAPVRAAFVASVKRPG
ncbi:MAG: SDR family NAD(P)-dependent oxidoreductase [Clostridia bacterium]|nr:SDR family NAD(P)-dependent oxidoreductase [Clostridia bacterium]